MIGNMYIFPKGKAIKSCCVQLGAFIYSSSSLTSHNLKDFTLISPDRLRNGTKP